MMLKKFFSDVNKEFLDDLFEAKALVKKQTSVAKPQAKAAPAQDKKPQTQEKKTGREITPEQKKKWASWTPGEQNYTIKSSPNGVYSTAVKNNILKLKDSKAKAEKHGKDDTGAEAVDHTEHAKLSGNKDFEKIVAANVPDETKASHFDKMLSKMKGEEKLDFLEKIHSSYGKGGIPKWAESVYMKHHKVSSEDGEKETTKKGEGGEVDVEKHAKSAHPKVADALRAYAKSGAKPKKGELTDAQMKDFEARKGKYNKEVETTGQAKQQAEKKEEEFKGKQKTIVDALKKKGGMSRQIIDIIDGDAKVGAYEGTEKAPGNKSSFINETSIGTCLSYLNDNPKLTAEELYQKLWNDIKDTSVVDKNGESKSKNAAMASAISAKAEHRRIKRIMKEDKMNEKLTTVSHVWGSKTSLQNTVDFLKKMGVKDVNGIPFSQYEPIILSGGAGDNPTDTMTVLLDHSIKPPKAIILHTSNKTSTADIQGNSGPVKNVERMLSMAEEDMNKGKLSPQEYEKYKKASDKMVKRLRDKQAEVQGVISKEYDKLHARVLNPKELPKIINEVKTMSGGDTPAKYWHSLVKKYNEKKPPTYNPPLSDRKFNEKTGVYTPPLTPAEEKTVMLKYANQLRLSVTDDEAAEDITAEMNKIASRLAPYDRNEMMARYKDQYDIQNEARKEMNKALSGKGDEYAAKLFLNRFHGDLAFGHSPGGIPPKYFETNMGLNKSRIRYDEKGNPWERKTVSIDVTKGKGKEKKTHQEEAVRYTRTVDGHTLTRTATGLKEGDTATTLNSETLRKCFGVKNDKDAKDFHKRIKISEIKYGEADDDEADSEGKMAKGPTACGRANIYGIDKEGKEFFIGIQTLRPKGGEGSPVNDTIHFHNDFQTCLQLESHSNTKMNEMFKYILYTTMEYLKDR